jgi:hypothetical protein
MVGESPQGHVGRHSVGLGGLGRAVLECAAQLRLYRRYHHLTRKTKPAGKVITALARELVGFIWAIGCAAESPFAVRVAA